ncbi:MAG: glycosyltransferase family 8 protein [Clostridia bacterium]|nr:glycosyltransferase family 8 protein [Clostridia bacterium]
MQREEIPIFFTIDDKYAPYLNVAIKSLTQNASKEYNYKIIILHEGLNKENTEKIQEYKNEKFDIEFIHMKDRLKTITDREENRFRYFTLTIYYRLFIPEMFPEYDKGIYIDSDIVVPGDISELYNIELENNLIGACQDHSVVDIEEFASYMEDTVGISRYEYVNSGVLLMNLKLLREKQFSKRFLELLNKYHFDNVAPDQDYLNAMCNGKILYLDAVWDAMPTPGRKEISNPKLIHYNLFQKPWCYDNIQYEDYFWKYAKKTSYYKELMDFKNNYSDMQKKADEDCLNTMLKKAKNMWKNEITFKKVIERGEKIRL